MDSAESRVPWQAVIDAVEDYRRHLDQGPVLPATSLEEIEDDLLETFPFDRPIDPDRLVELVSERMARWQVHTTHRDYWGLYNPDTKPVTVAADALVASAIE